MSTEILNLKRNHKNSIKYFIFSLFVFVMIFAFHLGGESVSAVESFSYTIHQSNHNGEKLDGTASSNNAETRSAGYKSNWYVQGTGVIKKDVISLTLQIPYMNINGISVIETGYTDSSGSGYYDSYKKIDGEWINQTDSGLPKGSVLSSTDALCTTNFDTAAARDSRLVANGAAAASGVYSLMCISEVQNTVAGSTDPGTITIQYVYTIRNGGYGEKEIVFSL